MRFALLAACGLLVVAPSLVAQVPVPGPFPPTFTPPPPPMTLVERNRNLIPVLLESLKDKDEIVRRNASEALRGLGSDAIPSLLEVLNGKDNSLRPAAAVLLGNMGPKAEVALPTLLGILKNKKEPPELRRAVSRTIALLVGTGPVSRAGTPGGELQLASFTTESKPVQALEGTWKRTYSNGEITLRFHSGRLHASWTGTLDKAPRGKACVAADADYAMTNDSLVYGVITNYRPCPDHKDSSLPASAVLETPFSVRYRIDGNRLVLKFLRIYASTEGVDAAYPGVLGEYVRCAEK